MNSEPSNQEVAACTVPRREERSTGKRIVPTRGSDLPESVMPDVQIPEREERRLPRQCSLQKGKFITDLSQGLCHNQPSGAGSESPEPKLLHKLIG